MRNWLDRPFRLWFLFTSLFFFTARGQEYSYARYDVKDGLAGSVVYHGVEDRDGFLWFATETGVSRFDGTHFKNFTKADGLPDDEILKLFVDSKGRVWMMPFKNSICYYYKGKIYNQENDSMLKKLSIAGRITSIVEDRLGNLLLADRPFLYFIKHDQAVRKVSLIDGKQFTAGNVCLNTSGNFSAFIDSADRITFLADFDVQGNITRKKLFLYKPTPALTSHNSALSTYLQVYTLQDSLFFVHQTNKTLNALAVPHTFNSLSLINDTLCSINTGNGAIFYHIGTGKVIRHVLRDIIINAVFQDSEGNSWFLTSGTGVFRIGSFEFINYVLSENSKNNRSVFSIYKSDSMLYAGSEKSLLFTVDLNRQTVHHLYLFKKPNNNRILSIVPSPSGSIFLGTDQGIIDLHRPEVGKGALMSVKSLQADRDSLLACVEHGLLLVSKKNGYRDLRLTYDQRATCGYVQHKIYYVGTLNGLYAQDSTGKIAWLGEGNQLSRSRITDIEGAPDSTLWISTHDNGVIGYKNGKIIYSIRQKDGLTSDICRTIFVADQDIWVGTDRGLNRIQWQQGRHKITTYTTADGLNADIINAIYVHGTQVYVGTSAGLTTFDADKISLHSFCKLHMTGMQAARQTWNYDTTGFVLPPSGNAIRFDYVGISYRSAGDITYRYRMVGLNDNWQTTRETFLSYPSLPSGDYELQLVATNKFGVKSNLIRTPFRIEKFLWEKNWFRLLALLITGILIWIFVNARIKKIRRQNDEKLQINNRMTELEQMALKAQMNPHFIFNSLNSVQQYVIDKDLRGANKFITDFSRLIRLTLDISSKNKISIYEEISYLTTYLELEKTKFEDKFSYSVTVGEGLDPSDWYIPPMILQPYVENSIRHGVRYRHDKLGEIRVTMELNEQYLICRVEDNGVGRKTATQFKSQMPIEYQSKGMSLTARRIEMLNKHQQTPVLIHVEDILINNQVAGTRVVLQFPVQEAGQPN